MELFILQMHRTHTAHTVGVCIEAASQWHMRRPNSCMQHTEVTKHANFDHEGLEGEMVSEDVVAKGQAHTW